MAVGKGSILRASSANAATKEKTAEILEENPVREQQNQDNPAEETKTEKKSRTVAKSQSTPISAVSKVPVEALKSVPKTWGIPEVNEEQLTELADSISKFGMLIPITVYKNKKQDLLILKGYHRAAAAKQAGITEVPVFFIEADTDSIAKSAFAELRSFETVHELEKEYEVISSITANMPAYLL